MNVSEINGNHPASKLTKRELFAAMAMQGFLSDYKLDGAPSVIAEASVEMADALLKELNK